MEIDAGPKHARFVITNLRDQHGLETASVNVAFTFLYLAFR